VRDAWFLSPHGDETGAAAVSVANLLLWWYSPVRPPGRLFSKSHHMIDRDLHWEGLKILISEEDMKLVRPCPADGPDPFSGGPFPRASSINVISALTIPGPQGVPSVVSDCRRLPELSVEKFQPQRFLPIPRTETPGAQALYAGSARGEDDRQYSHFDHVVAAEAG
jgi:hypothetical protein